jgi:predicted transposase/invertase (TIGR01784 family)
MSILDKIPSLAGNELFQKLAAIEDVTALSKEDQEKYDDAIKVMRDQIAAYKGAIIEAKIEVAKNMLMKNEPVDKIARYTGLSEKELLRIKAKCAYTQVVTLG